MTANTGIVFNIQRFCLHDGPGIRTTVFLKGCPLHCLWCDNPESQDTGPQLGFSAVCCDKCGKCVAACPRTAVSIGQDGMPQIDRDRCDACEKCVPACTPGALAIYGKQRTVEDVFADVRRDGMFFKSSKGGVTASGGEPLRQLSFVTALFKLCRESGIHTAVETCGCVGTAAIRDAMAVTDLFLFDLKHMDPEQHRRLTGQPNDLILANARMLIENKAGVQFRMPLIPGCNDSRDNLEAMARFLKEVLGDNASVELMPYHRLGIGKYQALSIAYPLEGSSSAEPDYVAGIKRTIEEFGVQCLVSS